jgi:hypothetical protein
MSTATVTTERPVATCPKTRWPDLEEFKLGSRDEQHRAELDLIYHQERCARLAARARR